MLGLGILQFCCPLDLKVLVNVALLYDRNEHDKQERGRTHPSTVIGVLTKSPSFEFVSKSDTKLIVYFLLEQLTLSLD